MAMIGDAPARDPFAKAMIKEPEANVWMRLDAIAAELSVAAARCESVAQRIGASAPVPFGDDAKTAGSAQPYDQPTLLDRANDTWRTLNRAHARLTNALHSIESALP